MSSSWTTLCDGGWDDWPSVLAWWHGQTLRWPMAVAGPSKPHSLSSRLMVAHAPCGLIIYLRGSDSLFHIFTNKLNLKLCQDPRALVFHLPTLLIKEAGRPPPNIGGITGVSSFCFHQLASNIISPIYDWFIYNWCRSVLIPGSVPRNKDLNARIRLSTTS